MAYTGVGRQLVWEPGKLSRHTAVIHGGVMHVFGGRDLGGEDQAADDPVIDPLTGRALATPMPLYLPYISVLRFRVEVSAQNGWQRRWKGTDRFNPAQSSSNSRMSGGPLHST